MCPTDRDDINIFELIHDNSSDDGGIGESEDTDLSDLDTDSERAPPRPEPEEIKSESEDEEEDEVVKAIKLACKEKRDHPPPIKLEDHVTDICFHPEKDLIAVASVTGDVILYSYTNDMNKLVCAFELHTKSCRNIKFSIDGDILFSTSVDKTIMMSDVNTEKVIRYFEDSHEVPLSCITILDEHLFATGDDDGTVKLWDLRLKSNNQIYKAKRNEDYISEIITNEAKKYLICSSGDGSLTTFDLQARKFFMQSEEYEEELTCLGLFREETKVLSGSSKGKLFLYNWHEFGLHSDAFPGPKMQINSMVPITQNIVVTASEDGNLRATHLFPHRHLGVVGQHQTSVENVDICNDGRFIASSSHDNDVRFWNIQYFENFETISRKHKKHETKKELLNNLPSSHVKNVSDFFSEL